MSKFNPKKVSTAEGVIAGRTTSAAGKYTNEQLLRRVTLANLLFEDTYYNTGNKIADQMEDLVKKVKPQVVLDLAIECREQQKLRHTPLWLIGLTLKHHGTEGVRKAIESMNFRPDMCGDLLRMLAYQKGKSGIKGSIPQCVRKGLGTHLSSYNDYKLGKYARSNSEISLVDVVNLIHPKSTPSLDKLMKGELKAPDTWEVNLSRGDDKKATFERMIAEKSLGSMAILRNLRNMKEAGVPRATIINALSQVNSNRLLPLDFLKAARIMPEYTLNIDMAMQRSFEKYKIPGTTILAIDVSRSMGALSSQYSNFSRLDCAFACAALGSYIFEDTILVFTAGSDHAHKGAHTIWTSTRGLGIFNDFSSIRSIVGGGGIFTHQLCEWLKSEGLAKDAQRLVVFSDSQDIDVYYGKKVQPDTTPYDHSYIIDISSETHGIKTGVWDAEINGHSDAIFRYISAIEMNQ